jgi:GxxExxY protein
MIAKLRIATRPQRLSLRWRSGGGQGYGFLEKVYENAMIIEFKKEGIPAVAQFPIKVLYEEEIVGEYYADILVATKVIVEIKAVKNLLTEHACPVKCPFTLI